MASKFDRDYYILETETLGKIEFEYGCNAFDKFYELSKFEHCKLSLVIVKDGKRVEKCTIKESELTIKKKIIGYQCEEILGGEVIVNQVIR